MGLFDVQASISSGSQPTADDGAAAAALAVLELVTRAQAARDPASVRSGTGACVSRDQVDKSAGIQALLPLQVCRGARGMRALNPTRGLPQDYLVPVPVHVQASS